MVTKISKFVKDYQEKIVLAISVILIASLAFLLGYIYAKIQEKQPLRIIEGESMINKHLHG